MKQAPPPNSENKANSAIRHMGMSLAVIGSVVLAAGLVAVWYSSEDHPKTLLFSIVAVGGAMLIAGFSIWRTNRT